MFSYINVDTYGNCGNLRCMQKGNVSCMNMVNTTYKVEEISETIIFFSIIIPVLPIFGEFPLQRLYYGKVLENPALQCDSNSAEWCKHD